MTTTTPVTSMTSMTSMTSATHPASWLVPLRRPDRPRARLVCVPNAGGGATTFRGWADLLPGDVELWAVRSPGRETRISENPPHRLSMIVDPVIDGLSRLDPLPFALFGHSMGALVSFTVTRRLRSRGLPGPGRLFVSGWNAPQARDGMPRLGQLGDEDLMRVLHRLDGIPPEVIGNAELMSLVMPVLRADLNAAESYVHEDEPPLACPISVFGGNGDPTTTAAGLSAWSAQTGSAFRLRLLPGGHFFIHTQRRTVLRAIRGDLGTCR
ncbi:thioesterase II family protein [Streptosporangium sp. NBC_01469]|uniref:thioesterase II family protein n=1 Tax=Streptosporangium sp. NBC_01469 TaxID=2903898 RepID=UPI002E2E8772|nr:alpha/beta fold hydrolase [Streptosporangium sp. NBC_01469]